MKKGFGARERKEHILDYCGAFRTKSENLPKQFILEDSRIPDVRDQGAVNSCVGFAATGIMQIMNYLETGNRGRFSAGYFYGKFREGDEHEGMIVENALDIWRKMGVCFEKEFPYNEEVTKIIDMVNEKPELGKTAEPYKISGYEVYSSAAKEIKYAMIKQALFTHNIPVLATTDYFGGSHAVCVIGWDDDKEKFTILNSWGKDWGSCGIGTVPYQYIKRGYLILDAKNNSLMPFTDVTEDKWYYSAVKHVYNAGLMNGTSGTTFDPEKTMTRAEMAQVLVNLCKKLDGQEGDS